ncbi:red pigment-concentrating hormone [Macrobrachium rosenbergii]|uniref:Red pigment concentrating hormone n=1 Tax=Macrobrachium rosenbergii TaxID=79674 RepID=D8KWQ8_MACRS|nr:red pigment concentrating hormone [Macrobrachium rosenbergii]
MVRSGVSLVLAVLVLVSCVSAQLNFSPGWGKRAAAAGVGTGSEAQLHSASGLALPGSSVTRGDNCASMQISTVMHIYRLIKREASRLVQCQDEEYLA